MKNREQFEGNACVIPVKGDVVFPTFIFTHIYCKILRMILEGWRPQQMANALEMKPQNLNHYLNRLHKARVIQKGPRVSFRIWDINIHLEAPLKQALDEFERGQTRKLTEYNGHHIEVQYPILSGHEISLGVELKRWKNSSFQTFKVAHDGFIFEVRKTSRNLIIGFPKDIKIVMFWHDRKTLIQQADMTAVSLVEPVLNQVLRRAGSSFQVGPPKVTLHFAFKDAVANYITRQGITIGIQYGKDWMVLDKSPHFSPKGEFETNSKEMAQSYLELMENAAKINELVNYLPQIKEFLHEFSELKMGKANPFIK